MNKPKSKFLILMLIILSGFISAYYSYTSMDYLTLKSVMPAIFASIIQIVIYYIIKIPSKITIKTNLYVIAMTIISWFISLTILIK